MKYALLGLLLVTGSANALPVGFYAAPQVPVTPGPSDPLASAYYPSYSVAGVPSYVWNTDISTKVKSDSGNPGTIQVSTPIAMKLERVAFQIHFQAKDTTMANVNVRMTNLTNAKTGDIISSETVSSANNFFVGVASYVYITTPTALPSAGYDGYSGALVPGPIIPAIDHYYHQKTNALPIILVPSGRNQSIVFEVIPPSTVASGYYSGTIWLDTGTAPVVTFATVPVILTVLDRTMPATSSLISYNKSQYSDMCIQQYGGPTNTGCKAYNNNAADDNDGARIVNHDACVFLLDYRWSCGDINEAGDTVATVQTKMSHLLQGTTSSVFINTLLPGAKLTSAQIGSQSANQATVTSWLNSFNANSEFNGPLLPFEYVCDEPGGATLGGPCKSSSTVTQAVGASSLITTDFTTANNQSATPQIDAMLPTNENLAGNRALYSTWLLSTSSKTLGAYADCLSSKGSCAAPVGTCTSNHVGTGSGEPNPHTDGKAVNNRFMAWQLWFDSAAATNAPMELNSTISYCWTHACGGLGSANPWAVGGICTQGQGDETWAHPGTTAIVGVSTPIFIPDMTLILSAAGHQDYEYMQALSLASSTQTVWTAVNSWVASESSFNEDAYQPTGAFTGSITSARHQLACGVHRLLHPEATCLW